MSRRHRATATRSSSIDPRWRSDGLIRLGVSSCLLGNAVRYDGGHRRDRFLTDVLGRFVEWVPVCPEVEAGMGVPRETIRLVRRGDDIRLVGEKSGTDHTAAIRAWARRCVRQLEKLDLCGCVLKKDSPSCGMARMRMYGPTGVPAGRGRGLFADELMGHLPSLPVEEEGRLHDQPLRENFVERVFAYERVRSLFGRSWTSAEVFAFHAAHKLQLLAHSPRDYRALGRIVAGVKQIRPRAFRRQYEDGFMGALSHRATTRRHVNVLQHVVGHLRGRIEDADRAELQKVIEAYGNEELPLVVPITLVSYHVRRARVAHLEGQVYLDPHPTELMLRNHV